MTAIIAGKLPHLAGWNHQKPERREVERDAAAIAELMRMSSRGGDERPVEALSLGCRCGVVGERPNAGDRGICGDWCPVREGQVRTGLERYEKIWRGAEDDGRVGGRSGDAGKDGSLQRWQTAAIAVECNRSNLCQRPAVYC